MIHALRSMIECRWSAHRIQRYLDADPSASLGHDEVLRLERHLAVCDRCGAVVQDRRELKAALAHLGDRLGPDPARVARLRLQVQRLSHGDGPRA